MIANANISLVSCIVGAFFQLCTQSLSSSISHFVYNVSTNCTNCKYGNITKDCCYYTVAFFVAISTHTHLCTTRALRSIPGLGVSCVQVTGNSNANVLFPFYQPFIIQMYQEVAFVAHTCQFPFLREKK